MKEMQYTGVHCVTELDGGKIRDFQYKIISYGSHPCAYVRLPEDHPLYKHKKLDDTIDVHGGITYHGRDKFDGEWIGWDYAHWDDRTVFVEKDHTLDIPGHNWTTEEMLEDVKDVIRQLEVMGEGRV